jgi:hypothetical protein
MRGWMAFGGLMLACEVAPPDDDIVPPAVTGPDLAPCAPAEAILFAATLTPAPTGERAELRCEIAAREGDGEQRLLDLACDDGPAQLLVSLAPAPPGDAFTVGQALRITAIRSPDAAGTTDVWLRVETTAGRLLLAAVAAGRLNPPDGSPWPAPFAVAEAASACMTEESACGASQRAAAELRLSGGAPTRLVDGTATTLGDAGEYVVHLETARVAPPGSECRARWQLGLLATR